ncbi:MAG: hypothetical protein ACOYLE_10900 [Bacteroidales bacterium]
MIKGRTNVIELLEENRCAYWLISSGPKEHIKAHDESTGLEENFTFNQSLPHLQRSLDRLEPGKYWIAFWDDPKSKNTRLGEWFLIEGSTANNETINGLSHSAEDIDTKIQKAVANEREKWETTEKIKTLDKEILQHTTEKAQLQKELREAKAELDSSQMRMLNKVEPFIGQILGSIFKGSGVTPAIAGNGTRITFDDPEFSRLENALNLWAETEPMEEIIFLIEKIAAMTKENPGTYAMAKNMLKS